MRKARLRLKAVVGALALLLTVAAGALYFFLPDVAYRATIGLERRIAGLEPAVVRVGDHQWHYLAGGEGPVLVLLHGFAADKDNWLRVARHLTDHYRVIAPDLIGFGESSKPPDADYDVATQALRVLGLLDALGVDRFHLGGSSMGGQVAGAITALRPEAVASLWLLAPAGVADAQPSEMFPLIQAGNNPLIPSSIADFDRTLAFVFSDRPFIPDPIAEHMARQLLADRPLLERIFSQLRFGSEPLEKYLAGRPVPTLIVWGEEDRVLHPSGAAVLSRLMPRAQVRMLERTGHLPMVEAPRRVARDYLEWQDTLSSETSPAN